MPERKEIYNAGILPDTEIKKLLGKEIEINSPGNESVKFDESQIQLGSIDLHFKREYKTIKLGKSDVLTYDMLEQHTYTEIHEIEGSGRLRIEPGEVVLTTTLESVILSSGIAGIITGRSSIARLGIMVHCCQEYINPGHGAPIPLQIINLAPCTVELDLDVAICQLVLFRLSTPASMAYKENPTAKYSNQEIEDSKIYLEADTKTPKTKEKQKKVK